ncbi:ATP-binding cassette domain-containing protein, partial [Natronobacterium gregoryi]
MSNEILRINGLSTRFFTEQGQVNAVEDLDLTIERGDVVGIVGESGSGKSVTARSIVDLIESPGQITDGEIWFDDPELAATVEDDQPDAVDGDFVDLRRLPDETRRSLRGTTFSMIFQDP